MLGSYNLLRAASTLDDEGSEMILEQISQPEDLRGLSQKQLTVLCEEIRTFLVDTVQKNGGHLGSNLGIVELTIALHRVLDSPNDAILFDTGHQAYVHKILTGRRKEFDNLRKAGHLAGYPSRAESNHDWIENSHASTALAYAHGLATADAAQNKNKLSRRIVAVIGDGSLTGGMAFEGLNNLGHAKSKVTIIYNDNGRSYAPTVSLLSESLVKIRSNPTYMKRQQRLERFASRIPLVGGLWLKSIEASKAAVRETLEPENFFEPLGVRYMGPFDGHDIVSLEAAIKNADQFDGPVVLHVQTKKGLGYEPAENDEVKNMHDLSAMKPGSYTEAFSKSIVELAAKHNNVVAITAAMPDSTGLLPFGEKFGDRLIDVGIAEQHGVTAAAGMAMGGLRPVVAVYSTFLSRAFDQTNLDVGLHGQPVIFCLDRAGITGDDGPSHHGIVDLVLLSKIPGMTIFCPSSYQELQKMLHDAYDISTGPVAIRWPKTPAPHISPDETGTGIKAKQIRKGSNICLIGIGKMLGAAQEAASLLAADGIEATVWDPRCVKPLDAALLEDASRHKLVFTIEDGLANGGIGSVIAQKLTGKSETHVLGIPTEFIPHGKADAILADLGLDGAGVAATVKSLL